MSRRVQPGLTGNPKAESSLPIVIPYSHARKGDYRHYRLANLRKYAIVP